MAKNMPKIANVSIFCHILATYRQQNFTKLVEEVLNFNLVGHM